MKRLLPALLALGSAGAQADSLHPCPAAQAPQLPCRAAGLGVDAALVERLYPLSAGERPDRTILLYGPLGTTPFKPASHELLQPDRPGAAPAPGPVPLRANLLPGARMRPFGVEERVSIAQADGKLRLTCNAGERAAGVLVEGPWRLPRAALRLAVRYASTGIFALQAADSTSAARGTAHGLGALPAGESRAALGLPASLEGREWRQFVIQCPPQAATLMLEHLALEPVAGKAQPRAAWIWEHTAWRDEGDALLAWAKREAVQELFIAVPLDGAKLREPARLAAFVRRAHGAGIVITAVDGDPHMVLPSQRAATVGRALAYAAYNRAAAPGEKLRAMQFDVEPYLLGDDVLDPTARDREYLAMARALHAAAGGMQLEFVVPFWWGEKEALLAELARVSDGLAVMDYRTDPDEIVRFALPFLDWGTQHGKRVRIALEAARVAPELQRRYVRVQAGEAGTLLLTQAGGAQGLVLLRRPVKEAAGTLYRLDAERTLDGGATSFYGKRGQLRSLLPVLERDFSAWPGFGGIALHGWR